MIRFMINFSALAFVIFINYLANSLPFNNQTTGEIANRLPVLFTPAGYVFSIWALIYFLLFIWVLRGFSKKRQDLPLYKKATPLFVITCTFNSFWLFLWHYEYFLLSAMIMVSLLISLIFLYQVARKHATGIMDILPFSVYLGWISVATIANISYVLVHEQWDRFGLSDVLWTVIMFLVATVLALFFRIQKSDVAYPLVFVWAFIGIGVKI
ncbi:tryptophan-rich sensory protein [Anaerobacillus sp. CMMVII]|uniref:tryptophan-rich sensory protein n=1 Tax=Anaerobacillus sp. CMMVII TaxID=2755588 RepID=UPI0028E0A382|nr:tryptophan-rich sensory protein [Anaerobacillus sp. CMMVII]